MMADDLVLEIVTPDRMIFSGQVEDVTIPGVEGEMGILRGHTPVLTAIDLGELSYLKEGKRTYFAVSSGYAEILPYKVTLLVEIAERADVIDKAEVEKQKAEAAASLAKMVKEDPEYERITRQLQLADLMLKVAQKG
ncbi:MAG TPA: ATP synthase F1 subunit epsilon [Syntrophales bacterium]|nr:ATP synthase F1 subunit epsilon [Syntrophales bacterium]HPO35010.1 ATP synthase F1 subunit epsilon [Syntrophales bacterium]